MIKIERFDTANYHQLISWVTTGEMLMQFAGPAFTFPLTAAQLDASLADPNRYAFMALDSDGISMLAYAEMYLGEKSLYFGRLIIGEEKNRGKGIGQELVKHLLKYAFANFDRNSVSLNVFDWNINAINCYKKAGFVLNPGVKNERIVNGKIWISVNMIFERKNWHM